MDTRCSGKGCASPHWGFAISAFCFHFSFILAEDKSIHWWGKLLLNLWGAEAPKTRGLFQLHWLPANGLKVELCGLNGYSKNAIFSVFTCFPSKHLFSLWQFLPLNSRK